MPWGTAPSFCDGAAAILTVINGREFTGFLSGSPVNGS
jgi:hypothetical protein